MEISKNLKGTHLVKLAKLIIAVQKAGLQLDGYTVASVDQISSRVYIWSARWKGCVFIGLWSDAKPRWGWSCPNCDDEVDFPNYKSLEKFVEQTQKKYNDKCADCARKSERGASDDLSLRATVSGNT